MNSGQIKGLPIIGITEGATLGAIDDLYVDVESRRVLGFYIVGANGVADAYLDADNVRSIGADAVMVEHEAAVRGDATRARIGSLVSAGALLKRRVMTEGGMNVGAVANVEFEPPDFAFTQLEVSPGLFTANAMIPIAQVISIGTELVIVSDAVGAAKPDEPAAEEAEPEPGSETAPPIAL